MCENSFAPPRPEKMACNRLRTACATLRKVIRAGVHGYFEEYVAEEEKSLAENDPRGYYEHFKASKARSGWGRKAKSEQCVRDMDGTSLLRDKT